MLGATSCYGPAELTGTITGCPTGYKGSPASVTAAANDLRARGGIFQINHPAIEMTAVRPPFDESLNADSPWDWKYGFDVVPDSVEVWNINWAWQPPAPSGSSHEDALRYYDEWLDRGFHVALTGGSDNHYRATAAVQGVGQPTTWVFAADRTAAAILAGIRAGRTFVSHQPPGLGGPRLFLEADADENGLGTFESMVGDTVPAIAVLRVRVENAPPGSVIRLVSDESPSSGDIGPIREDVVTAPVPGGASWIRAELVLLEEVEGRATREEVCEPVIGSETSYCRNRVAMLAMTSPIYVA